MDDPNCKIIPLKYDLEEVDMDPDTERTTASIKSTSTPMKNPFDDETTMADDEKKKPMMKESVSEGRMKRFLNDIKNNCKTTDTVVESK